MAKKEKKQKTQEKPKAEQKPKEDSKGKKGNKDKKNKKNASDAVANSQFDRSKMTAEQLTQAQIEEAIKESQDPSSRLKKIKSPLSVKSCLLNLMILIVLTVGIVLLVCWIKLDKETFNLWVVIKDILDKFKITDFFRSIGRWFKKIFS